MASSHTAGTAGGPPAMTPAKFIRSRGLTQRTLDKLGADFGMAFFPELDPPRQEYAIFFHYGEFWKARAVAEKTHVASKGFKVAFWNLDAVLKARPKTVYITEGELDAASLVEAGIPETSVLSVPNGAREKPADAPQELRGYSYVEDALRDGLAATKQFVWCGDMDDPGRALRADMVRLLGAARYRYVEWPEGCNDANATLLSEGADAVRDLVENGSLPWPVNGLYRLSGLPEPPAIITWSPGFPEWESKIKLAPTMLSVVTGHPNHGKTALFNQIWFNISQEYGVPICTASFETRPKPHIRRQLRALHSGKLELLMTDDEIAKADAWIEDHYHFAVHPDRRPSLEWLLDLAEVAVVRHGARVVQIDPWNRLEGQRREKERETDYIGRCLSGLYAFAQDMNCHVQIVAHPAKMDGHRRGDEPTLEDISDSKHWDNMPDQGFTVHRPSMFDKTERRTEAVLFQRKARYEELGYPCKLGLNYRLDIGRYVSTDYQLGGVVGTPKRSRRSSAS